MTTDQIAELAKQYGFLDGKQCGYSDPGLWVRDSEGGGSISVYPGRNGRRWVVAFFAPWSNIPFSSRTFAGLEQAFRYARSLPPSDEEPTHA